MIETLNQLLDTAKNNQRITVAVAGGDDEAALGAIVDAGKMGIANGLLFGDSSTMEKRLQELNVVDTSYIKIKHESDLNTAIKRAVESVRLGNAQILLKGKVKTSQLLRGVLDAEFGLRTGHLLSDVFLFEYPARASGNKLVMITDGGVTLCPDLNQKLDIIQNAVQVAHALGNDLPKVALLSAVETVVPNLPSTHDAAIITKMNERGQIKGCVIDGPLALDNAVSPEAARIKGIDSEVAGQAEILVCPTIEAANMLAKGTTYFANLRLCHVIMGAAAPVLIPSRADTADAKLLSIALGKLIYQKVVV
jgi:phosphate butyryltransferase